MKAKLKPAVDRAIAAALPRFSALVVDRISTEADRKFSAPVATAYKQGIGEPQVEEQSVTIELVSPFAIALERGSSSFDIKAGMLRSKSVKIGEQGPYVDVPFRHGTPGSSVLRGMPDVVKQRMDNAVRSAQSRLRTSGASKEDVATVTARLKGWTPGRVFTRTLTIGSRTLPMTVKHKRGIYDEMVRTAQMSGGGKRAQAEYHTFRRISGASAATSWWHPGFKPAHIFPGVLPSLEDQLRRIFVDACSAEGVKVR